MKKHLIILAFALLSFFANATEKYAQATFPNKTHDFGQIQESNGPVSCTFEFINTGDKPLIIIDAVASCGCTRPEYPSKPIKPGKKGKIKVTYNPSGRPGAFSKTIKVKTNGREKYSTLVIEGVAVPKSHTSD